MFFRVLIFLVLILPIQPCGFLGCRYSKSTRSIFCPNTVSSLSPASTSCLVSSIHLGNQIDLTNWTSVEAAIIVREPHVYKIHSGATSCPCHLDREVSRFRCSQCDREATATDTSKVITVSLPTTTATTTTIIITITTIAFEFSRRRGELRKERR